jgi:hypothetical protein
VLKSSFPLWAARYTGDVEKTARVFHSFDAADRADLEFYHSLTPEKRLEILFDIVARSHPDEIKQRSARVYRIIKLQKQ